MNITVQIPDDLAERLGTPSDISRHALEATAVGAFRVGRLRYDELGRLLHIDTTPLDQLLGRHGMPQPDEATRERARKAAEDIISQSKGVKLGAISLKELVNEGRP